MTDEAVEQRKLSLMRDDPEQQAVEASRSDEAEETGDGDEHDAEAGTEPVLWQGAAPAAFAAPPSPPPTAAAGGAAAKGVQGDHSSSQGGRPHAPF